MGASRATAARLLSVARDSLALGAQQALQKINLGALSGQPAADVFLVLLEIICPPGGSISEAISRQALLEAIEHLADGGAVDFDDLSVAQWEEFLLDFVSCSVEGLILAEIGNQTISVPEAAEDVGALQGQVHDFISGCVRDALLGQLDGVASLTDREIATTVNTVYEATFEYLSLLEGKS